MPSAADRFIYGRGNRAVSVTSVLRRCRFVDGGSEQRVRETDRSRHLFDHAGRERLLHSLSRKEVDGRPAVHGNEEQRGTRCRRQSSKTAPDEAIESCGRVAIASSRKLEHVEGIAAGRFVQAEEDRTRKCAPEPGLQQLLSGPDAQRPDRDLPRVDCALDDGAGIRGPRAASQQDRDPARREPPQRESEAVRRRVVEPLHVVDCDEQRTAGCEQLECVADCDPEGARFDSSSCRIFAEKGHLEGVPARFRERGQNLVHYSVEEIAQTYVGETPFGFRGP